MSVRRGQEIYAHACIPLDNASQEDAGYPSLRNYEYCQYYSLHGDKATHLDHPALLVAFRFRHDFGWKRWRFMTKLISSPGFGRLLFFNLGRDMQRGFFTRCCEYNILATSSIYNSKLHAYCTTS